MSTTETLCKITITIPRELVAFADAHAEALSTSRSRVISMALAAAKAIEDEQSAVNGYRFYAQEASEFAAATQKAVAEAWAVNYPNPGDEGTKDASAAR
jgi:metal-responsive CopG/Arc/MetJ family transcriptional regulator